MPHDDSAKPDSRKLSAAVLISGSGSNLQAIIEAISHAGLALKLALVLSDKAEAQGLKKAVAANISSQFIDPDKYPTRDSYDAALAEAIEQSGAKLVILAGFMRILSDNFVNHYLGRLINIHPSLLPRFPGLNTHQRALDARCRFHGASVHFVTADLDAGPIIAQAQIEINKDDSATTLATRVLEIEHKLYPRVLNLYAQNRLKMQQESFSLDGKNLEHPLQYNIVTDNLNTNSK
jgi:phosphoribosylglycinamide formyltransferase-1